MQAVYSRIQVVLGYIVLFFFAVLYTHMSSYIRIPSCFQYQSPWVPVSSSTSLSVFFCPSSYHFYHFPPYLYIFSFHLYLSVPTLHFFLKKVKTPGWQKGELVYIKWHVTWGVVLLSSKMIEFWNRKFKNFWKRYLTNLKKMLN